MLNDVVMVAIILTLVFGSVIFYLYTRLCMTERKMGLFEGIITDLKIMIDAAPFAYGGHATMREFDNSVSPEYLNAISGPMPIQKDEVEDVSEEYQQTLEQALSSTVDTTDMPGPYRSLQIDEHQQVPAISVTKLSPDLESMTVKELTGLAKQRGMSVPAGTRRKDLIELLKTSTSLKEEIQGALPSFLGESLDVAAEVTL